MPKPSSPEGRRRDLEQLRLGQRLRRLLVPEPLLTGGTKGCAAVSVLTGAEALCDCHLKAKAAHCDHLKTNTVDEILAMYDKLCPRHEECEDGDASGAKHHGNDYGCDDDEEWDVCDHCGHRHRRERDPG
jgi:hypothetical protein